MHGAAWARSTGAVGFAFAAERAKRFRGRFSTRDLTNFRLILLAPGGATLLFIQRRAAPAVGLLAHGCSFQRQASLDAQPVGRYGENRRARRWESDPGPRHIWPQVR